MKRYLIRACAFLALGGFVGCGNSGVSGGNPGNNPDANQSHGKVDMYQPISYPDSSPPADFPPGFNNCAPAPITTASGVVYAPNGMDPVSGATIYTVNSMPSPIGGATCEACVSAPVGAVTSTHSDVNGNFSIAVGGSSQYIVIEIGHFRRVIPTSSLTQCTANTLPPSSTSLPTKANPATGDTVPKIAVTTGSQDHMQNILLKIGLDASAFDVYEGRNPIPSSSASESHCGNIAGGAGCTMDQLLGSLATMQMYDLIFIDCRDGYESALLDPTMGGTAVANIQQFITHNGRLFVDDESFEYVEQAFPEVFSWEPNPTPNSSTPETYYPPPGATGSAKYETHADFGVGGKVGTPMTYPATINTSDPSAASLASWLTARGATLTGGNGFTAEGFLNYWAAMNDVSTTGMFASLGGYKFNSTTWVTGNVSWYAGSCGSPPPTASGTKPLTASFDVHSLDATSCGRVLYSSYHTNPGSGGENTPCMTSADCTSAVGASACSPLGFCWNPPPAWTTQERILEYMVLQVGTCIKILG